MAYENFKSHKKPGLQPLSLKNTFLKQMQEGGVKLTLPAILRLKKVHTNKLYDVTSKCAELHSLHNEVIERYDQNKGGIEKGISLTLEKEQLVNTVNDSKRSNESLIGAFSSQIQILKVND